MATPAFLHDQMTLRKLRLTAGLVMLSYLFGHLAMHALGNISFTAMQWGTQFHDFIWKSVAGTVLLYGAFATHFSLALWALYARDSFRMGPGEWFRLLLGFTILPLLIHHYAAGRYVYSEFGAVRNYDVVLTVYFGFIPWWGWRQIAVLLIAWTHACLGIHFWLRARSGYRRWMPSLLAFAVFMPTIALLGIWQGAREVLALGQADPDWLKAVVQNGQLRNPAVGGPSWNHEVFLYWLYAGLVAFALLARFLRGRIEFRRGRINIRYANGRNILVPRGWAVLDASRAARIPHAAVCGGRGRCTTCRIRVLRGLECLPSPEPSERAALARLNAGPAVRLACQLRPRGDVVVLPLLPPGIDDNDARRRGAASGNEERTLAILFVDIRRSTALVEMRMPYDVVFLLNHFFEAAAGAVVEAGGLPNQFLGDGMMAIFGKDVDPELACHQALQAAQQIKHRVAGMNHNLEHELTEPLAVGIGIHVGSAILCELGYREHFLHTAIGDTVHVAARLQELTKEFGCAAVVSEDVLRYAGVDGAVYERHDVQIRGRTGTLGVRAIASDETLKHPSTQLESIA